MPAPILQLSKQKHTIINALYKSIFIVQLNFLNSHNLNLVPKRYTIHPIPQRAIGMYSFREI